MKHTDNKTSEDEQIWLGMVPGQRLPANFSQMDADALRQLFVTTSIPVDVWEAINQLFDGEDMSSVNWLFAPAFGLGGLRPVEAIKTAKGKEDVLKLVSQLIYGVCP